MDTSTVKKFLDYAEEYDIPRIKREYLTKIKNVECSPNTIPRKSSRYLTHKELELLLNNVKSERNRLIFKLLYSTGCRSNEILSACVEHIDFENGMLYIPNTKNKIPRTVRIGKDTLNDLILYLHKNQIYSGYLFPSSNCQNGHLTIWRLNHIFREAVKKTNLERRILDMKNGHPRYDLNVHSLRKTHVVHAILKGVSIDIVSQQIGHKEITETMRIYSEMFPRHIKNAYDKAGFE